MILPVVLRSLHACGTHVADEGGPHDEFFGEVVADQAPGEVVQGAELVGAECRVVGGRGAEEAEQVLGRGVDGGVVGVDYCGEGGHRGWGGGGWEVGMGMGRMPDWAGWRCGLVCGLHVRGGGLSGEC